MSPKAEAEMMCRAGLDKDDLEVKFINSSIGELHLIKNDTIFLWKVTNIYFLIILLLNTLNQSKIFKICKMCFL